MYIVTSRDSTKIYSVFSDIFRAECRMHFMFISIKFSLTIYLKTLKYLIKVNKMIKGGKSYFLLSHLSVNILSKK